MVHDCHQDDEDQGRNNNLYDLDDDWIDDTELQEYYGGDRRKTKITGFFINRVSFMRSQGICPSVFQSWTHKSWGDVDFMSHEVLGNLDPLEPCLYQE